MTPKQVQLMSEHMRVRRHNDNARIYTAAGHDLKGSAADFIDPETEKMMKDISRQHQAQHKAELEVLESQRRAVNGQ